MSQHVNYANTPYGILRDERAIEDIKSYLTEEQWKVLLGEARKVKTGDGFQQLNIAMSFAGINGMPVHAFGRRYCLVGYRAWMATPDSEGQSFETDEHGFCLDYEEG